jgi:hypothetical protein
VRDGLRRRGVGQALAPTGGQAHRGHPELHAGLILLTVQGESVRGPGYQHALQQIKAAGRPVTLRFKRVGRCTQVLALFCRLRPLQ